MNCETELVYLRGEEYKLEIINIRKEKKSMHYERKKNHMNVRGKKFT